MVVQYFPILTIGIVVLNREWIIGKMLNSLLSQDYPHDRIYVLFVDGGSRDRTVDIARDVLTKSDIMDYDIIVRECSIPEGRNICVEKMRGEILVFWDSDVIMEPNALRELATLVAQGRTDIASAYGISLFVNSVEELDKSVKVFSIQRKTSMEGDVVEVPFVGMGHTAVSRRTFHEVQFDPDLTFSEDLDFSVKAREKGFKLVAKKGVRAYDVNLRKRHYSDIYVDMPLKKYFRGMRKKSKAHVLAHSSTTTFMNSIKFFLDNKRYIFYLGYIATVIFTFYGLITDNYLSTAFPVYFTFFIFWQIRRRGVKRGLQAASKSILFGVPFSTLLVYYSTKYAMINKVRKRKG